MKHTKKFLRGILALSFILSISQSWAATVVPEFKGGITQSALWKPSQKMFIQCSKTENSQNYTSCIINYMKQHGASPLAILFKEKTDGYAQSIKNYGNIQVVYAFMQGADYSDGYFLITQKGELINVDDFETMKHINIKNAAGYSCLHAHFPKAILWPGNHETPTVKQLESDEQQVIFDYQIKNGCNACEIVGSIKVGFNFGQDGSYLRTKILSLTIANSPKK